MKLLSVVCVFSLLGMLIGCAANPPAKKQEPAPQAKPELKRLPPPGPAIKPMMTVEEVENARLDGDIGVVHPSYGIFPWLQFDPTDPRPQGLAVSALYLISNKTEKGVFADGTIIVRVFRVDRKLDGGEVRTPMHVWQLDPEQAKPYRSHRRTVFGAGYGLMLQWPKDLDVLNKEILVLVEFARPDGRVIRSSPKTLKVPAKMSG